MATKDFNLEDAAYRMSMESDDPTDVLGYTQLHQLAVQHPISRAGWNPQYDVYMPVRRDYYNKGAETSYFGATPQAGSTWTMAGSMGPGEMMNSYLSDLARSNVPEDRIDARRWRSSDQTVYLNEQVRTQKKETPIHESVHRGIGKLYPKVFGDIPTITENELLTRIWDYRNADYGSGPKEGLSKEENKKREKERKKLERRIRILATKHEGLDPTKELVMLDYALQANEPTLDLMREEAIKQNKETPELDYSLIQGGKRAKF